MVSKIEIRVLDFRIRQAQAPDEAPLWIAARNAVLADPTGLAYGEFMGGLQYSNPEVYKRINAIVGRNKFDAKKAAGLLNDAILTLFGQRTP